jgi:hypothetical protein
MGVGGGFSPPTHKTFMRWSTVYLVNNAENPGLPVSLQMILPPGMNLTDYLNDGMRINGKLEEGQL